MAEEQKQKGTRIYSGGSGAKTTYQGSAKSGGFNAVKAANSDKAMAEYRRRIVEDGDAKMRELRREQDATTTSLRAQQTADAGMLKLEGQREADALRIDQKYDQDTLKQEHTYEEHKMALESSHLQAEGQVAASRIKVADSVIQGVASLSKSYLSFEADRQQEAERKEAITATNKAVFSIEDNPDPTAGYQAQAAQNAGTVAAADSINQVDSPSVQHALRREVSQGTIEGQRQRSSVYEAAADWPVFFNNWKNDTSVVYTRPNGGGTFTVASMEAGDAVQVSEAARKAFYSSAGLGSMPEAQVAQVLVPQIMQQSGSWELDVSNKIIAGQQSAAVRSATMDITDGLTAGDSIGAVFDNGFTALHLSNAFDGKGEANKATVDTILEYAVNNNRPDVIEALDRLEKIPGNPGTRIGKQYAGEIKKARTDIMQGLIDKNKLDSNYAAAAAETIERDLSLGLTKQGITDLEEQSLNQVAASKLMEHPTPENILRAKELLANKEYNPYTAQDMLIAQANGTKYTQDELQALVNSKDIKATEAEQLGWDKEGGESADTVRTKRVEGFRKLAEAQGTAILSTAASKIHGDSPEMVRIAVQGDGKGAKDSITDRLLADLDAKLKTSDGSEMKDDEIREWMLNQRSLLEQEVEYQKGGGFIYNFGRDAYREQRANHDFRGLSNAELKSYDAANNVDLSSKKLLTGRQFDSAIYSIENGEPFPAELEERAAAIGTNAETLVRSQLALYGQPYPKVATPVDAMPTASSSDAGLAAYDTGEQFGGISLDNLRNSVISKESAGVFTAKNPDSGALGYGQVMPANVEEWTTAALGYPVSQREYLRSPDIQMAVINDRFRKMMQEQSALGYTGDILVRRVASIWYSGNAGLYNNTRPQTYGAGTYPSIQSYTMDVVGRYRQG